MQYNLRKSSHWQPLFASAKDIARFTATEGNDDQKENTFISIQVISVVQSSARDILTLSYIFPLNTA